MKSKEILPDITRRTIAIILERDGFLGKMTIGDILNALLAAEEDIELKEASNNMLSAKIKDLSEENAQLKETLEAIREQGRDLDLLQ